MNEEELLQRHRYLDNHRSHRQLGIAARRACLIAEVTRGLSAIIVEETRQLRAAAWLLREEAAHLRRESQRRD